MKFFLPAAIDDEQAERNYVAFAKWAGCAVPSGGSRIECIRFRHDGEDWVAEVGKPLSGMRVEEKRRKAGRVTVRTPLSDPAIVLAIFPGDPYMVVTHARPITDMHSEWSNPFMAGRPSDVVYFDPPTPGSGAPTDGSSKAT